MSTVAIMEMTRVEGRVQGMLHLRLGEARTLGPTELRGVIRVSFARVRFRSLFLIFYGRIVECPLSLSPRIRYNDARPF